MMGKAAHLWEKPVSADFPGPHLPALGPEDRPSLPQPGLLDSANKNAGCSVTFEFQIKK